MVDDFFLAKNHVAYPVTGDDGDFRGMLRLEHLKELPREKWAWTTAGEVASSDGAMIDAGAPAESAMRRLLAAGQGRLAVIDAGRVVGIITRHDVLSYITIHTELEGKENYE